MLYLAIALRCLIGTVFAVSVLSKLTGRDAYTAFVTATGRLSALPPQLARPAAVGVLAAESAVCLLLAVPATVVAGFTAAAALLVTFAIAILRAVRSGTRQPCRCFGATSLPLSRWHAVRNLVLAVIAVAGALVAPATAPTPLAGAVLAAVSGGLLGFLATRLDDLIGLFLPVHSKAAGAARGPW